MLMFIGIMVPPVILRVVVRHVGADRAPWWRWSSSACTRWSAPKPHHDGRTI